MLPPMQDRASGCVFRLFTIMECSMLRGFDSFVRIFMDYLFIVVRVGFRGYSGVGWFYSCFIAYFSEGIGLPYSYITLSSSSFLTYYGSILTAT